MTKPATANAAPTKQFFVRMFTRDIELLDAVLDLLDNCVDGIIRSNKTREIADSQKPYQGFYAKITASPTSFQIEDNCGGIPRDLAENVAFRLGRPSDHELSSLGVPMGNQGTVGLYGIGMKRAIFKMGRRAVVESESNGNAFRVEIKPEWLDEPNNWILPLEPTQTTGTKGTRIKVTQLYPEIAHQFSSDAPFLGNLHGRIAELFAVIIGKGFDVSLNGTPIQPVSLKLVLSKEHGISPYVFRGKVKGVDVEVVVGFHRDPTKASEPDEDDAGDRSAAVMRAGWSVICNDRLVVYGDKSEMTGWGTKPVPYFHPQYNSIAGVVTMRSDNPELLPLNTAKRGIEVSVGVYLKVMDYMKDGVKRFIDYTNRWKGRLQDAAPQFRNARQVPAAEVAESISQQEYTRVGKSRLADDSSSAEEHKPELPSPPKVEITRRISFTKPVEDIRRVAEELFGDKDVAPSGVGEECFNRILVSVRKSRKKP
jgi:Histidine kinase-, DNA gyrase B-, and HSP90-like ATPase